MPNVKKHTSEKDCPKECPLANTKQFMSVVFIFCGSYGIMSLCAPFHAVSAGTSLGWVNGCNCTHQF